jgi:hypothetical protein
VPSIRIAPKENSLNRIRTSTNILRPDNQELQDCMVDKDELSLRCPCVAPALLDKTNCYAYASSYKMSPSLQPFSLAQSAVGDSFSTLTASLSNSIKDI